MNWIVFALHGNQPRYVTGMRRNVELLPRVYGPGWSILLYHDTTVPGSVISQFRSCGVVALRRVDQSTRPRWMAYEGRYWRLLALEDPLVLAHPGALVCHRDADSRISNREVQATMDFYTSGKLIHLMRDHPNHVNRRMLSGMWGWRVSQNPARLGWIVDRADKWLQSRAKLRAERPWSDDYFMRRQVYPKIKDVALEHDTFAGKPFPTLQAPGPFVGEVILVDQEGRETPQMEDRISRNEALTKLKG